MWRTVAKIISEPIYHRIGFMEFYKFSLENKEGVFECSFGKKIFRDYSEEKKICLLNCKKGHWGFICKKLEFLDNNKDITAWEEISAKKKKPTTENKEKIKDIDNEEKLTRNDKKAELNPEQEKIVKLVLEGKNICFLGEAGTGKSFLLKHLIEVLKEKYWENLFITSYTGRTAISIQGQTLHSFAGIGTGETDWHQMLNKITKKKKIVSRWKKCKVLIIDEISMLNGELFDKLEIIARQIKNTEKPFGSIQLVICGDFYQLAPIEKDYKWCFEANSWESCIDNLVYLKQIYRQKDNKLINLLQDVRNNHLSSESFELLESLKREPQWPEDGIKPTQLYSTNEEVNQINLRELINLPTSSITYYAKDKENQAKTLKILTKDCLAPEKLELKIGSQVMLTVNQFERKLVNGSQGIIINFKEEEEKKYPVVRFSGGKISVVKTFEHKLLEYRNNREITLASRCQIPLILCWAITIHKSQGQTIERLKIDCERIWAEGQLYVALSRATNVQYLQVINFHKGKIKTSQRVKEYYKKLKLLSL